MRFDSYSDSCLTRLRIAITSFSVQSGNNLQVSIIPRSPTSHLPALTNGKAIVSDRSTRLWISDILVFMPINCVRSKPFNFVRTFEKPFDQVFLKLKSGHNFNDRANVNDIVQLINIFGFEGWATPSPVVAIVN